MKIEMALTYEFLSVIISMVLHPPSASIPPIDIAPISIHSIRQFIHSIQTIPFPFNFDQSFIFFLQWTNNNTYIITIIISYSYTICDTQITNYNLVYGFINKFLKNIYSADQTRQTYSIQRSASAGLDFVRSEISVYKYNIPSYTYN